MTEKATICPKLKHLHSLPPLLGLRVKFAHFKKKKNFCEQTPQLMKDHRCTEPGQDLSPHIQVWTPCRKEKMISHCKN